MLDLKKRLAYELKIKLDKINEQNGLSLENIIDMFEYPPDSKMGDIALPCFQFSKILKKSPSQIADMLCENFYVDFIERIGTINGYLNFHISKGYYINNILLEILDKKEKYGSFDFGQGKNVVFDYSSPNIAKPFHIGHLGTTAIGHSLKKLHQLVGYNCIGINHLGDWGTQFGKLIVAYRKWGKKLDIEFKGIDELVSLYVKFHEEAEKDPTLENKAREEFKKLENGDKDNTDLWEWFIDISIKEYNKTYKQLGIAFDSYNGESFYSDKMPAVVKELKEKQLLKIDDGASIVDLEKYNMPPCLILKRDGSTLYPTRDIAAAIYRKKTYDFEKCIIVTSSAQTLHFAQLFKVVELMGYEWSNNLIHIPYGTVSINGEKLATRTGNVILLKDLLSMAIEKVSQIMDEKNPNLKNKDEIAESVGVGAIVFHYLSNNRIKDINFVLEDALSFEGNTGPYAQYTYARTCSIIEKANNSDQNIELELTDDMITADEEKEILKVLALFPERVLLALREYEPSIITRYILDVCAAFNVFYHNCQILSNENESTRNIRIMITKATKYTLGNAFDLICLKKTEKI